MSDVNQPGLWRKLKSPRKGSSTPRTWLGVLVAVFILCMILLQAISNRPQTLKQSFTQSHQPVWAPQPRTKMQLDGRWRDKHEALVAQANSAPKRSIAFFGDSITEQFQLAPAWLELQATVGSDRPLLNFGVGGDRVEHLLFRMTHGELMFPENARPAAVFIMIGTNNIADDTPDDIFHGIRTVVELVEAELQSVPLFVLSLTPRGRGPNVLRDRLASLNDLLAKFFRDRPKSPASTTFVPWKWNEFYESNTAVVSKVDVALMHDFLHLTQQGYQKMKALVESALRAEQRL